MNERFLFRTILPQEADQAAEIEEICFPPEEACTEKMMKDRAVQVADLFFVAVDRETGKIAGFLNGIATDETEFRDEFFEDAGLHDPNGKTIMLLGLNVLPAYRRQGLAGEIVRRYMDREAKRGREKAVLTCLDAKVKMYEKMGFLDEGISGSRWGGKAWHKMSYSLNQKTEK